MVRVSEVGRMDDRSWSDGMVSAVREDAMSRDRTAGWRRGRWNGIGWDRMGWDGG